MSEKWGLSPKTQEKSGYILFVVKRGLIIYLTALKKGAIRHAHPYYAIYRKILTTAPPPTRVEKIKGSNESEETEEIKTSTLYPYLLQG